MKGYMDGDSLAGSIRKLAEEKMGPRNFPSVERVKKLTQLIQRAQRAHDAGDKRKALKFLRRARDI